MNPAAAPAQAARSSRRRFLTAAAVWGAAALGGWTLRRSRGEAAVLRPPGAVSEQDFLARCIRCAHCIDVCPVDALVPLEHGPAWQLGTPHFRPREQPCTLCAGSEQMACVQVCPTDALRPLLARDQVAVGVARIDPQTCLPFQGVVCRACWRACPFPDEAIRLDELGRPVVDGQKCVGCGLCQHACLAEPEAIRVIPFAPRS